jgi:hypothetical protein
MTMTDEARYWREKAAHLRRLKRDAEDAFVDIESVAEEYDRRAADAERGTPGAPPLPAER